MLKGKKIPARVLFTLWKRSETMGSLKSTKATEIRLLRNLEMDSRGVRVLFAVRNTSKGSARIHLIMLQENQLDSNSPDPQKLEIPVFRGSIFSSFGPFLTSACKLSASI